jgi:hypothetical protein
MALGSKHPNAVKCLENYVSLLRKMDRPDKAEPLDSRAKAILAKKLVETNSAPAAGAERKKV